MIEPEASVVPEAPAVAAAVREAPVERRLLRLGYASFALIGWSGLLVPSLIRQVEHDFGQTDAALGFFYLLAALSGALGSAAGGVLTERVGRRFSLPLAAASATVGLALLALAPSWPVFLLASVPLGAGTGAVDAGVNGLFLELHPGRGGPLNQLHLFYSLGALSAPLVVGWLVDAGLRWTAIPLGSAAFAVVAGRLLAITPMPSGRHHGHAADAAGSTRRLVSAPILLLAAAIACYVAAEIGTSSWLVRFLAAAPLSVATAALSLFWAGLALGRFLAARFADRFDAIPLATACSFVAGIAVAGAAVVPGLPPSIALFGLAGLAMGPIYPLIMSIAGTLYPGRSGAVSGLLTSAAVVGGVVYPPLIGFISLTAGIAAGILGAGILAVACALFLGWAGALGARETGRG